MKTYTARFGTGDPRTFSGLSPTFLIFQVATGSTVTPPGITEIPTASGLYYWNWGTTTPIAFLLDGLTTSLGSGRYVTGQLDPADRSDEYGNTLIAFGSSLVALGNSAIALGVSNVALGSSHVAQGNTMIALGTSIYALEQTLGSTLVGIGNTAIALGTTSVALGITNVAIGSSLSATSVTIVVSVAGIGTAGSTFGGMGTDPVDLFGYVKRLQELFEGNSTFTKATGNWALSSRGSSAALASKTIINTSTTVTKT